MTLCVSFLTSGLTFLALFSFLLHFILADWPYGQSSETSNCLDTPTADVTFSLWHSSLEFSFILLSLSLFLSLSLSLSLSVVLLVPLFASFNVRSASISKKHLSACCMLLWAQLCHSRCNSSDHTFSLSLSLSLPCYFRWFQAAWGTRKSTKHE